MNVIFAGNSSWPSVNFWTSHHCSCSQTESRIYKRFGVCGCVIFQASPPHAFLVLVCCNILWLCDHWPIVPCCLAMMSQNVNVGIKRASTRLITGVGSFKKNLTADIKDQFKTALTSANFNFWRDAADNRTPLAFDIKKTKQNGTFRCDWNVGEKLYWPL